MPGPPSQGAATPHTCGRTCAHGRPRAHPHGLPAAGDSGVMANLAVGAPRPCTRAPLLSPAYRLGT